MGKYYDERSAKQIGEQIRTYRKDRGYSLEDVASLTGFTVNTISSIENGGDTTVSYLIAICQGIGVYPKQVLDIEMELKSRFELPPSRKHRSLLTNRINKLLNQTNFFDEPKLVVSVVNEFIHHYGFNPDSSEISTALKKLSDEGKLVYSKTGRKNLYIKSKKY
ncbi:MAG TPA: helix-turn-helix transcriptional regulator [Sphingobacteriaceae bacterium]|nr:helix-turn-helix transcriptional regulator [Sphingobacteriaceae bacterium]